MKTYYILYNPKAGNGRGKERAEELTLLFDDEEARYLDMMPIHDYAALFSFLMPEDALVLCGGDGTLNRFVNETQGLTLPNDILYYATGTGNDFLEDIRASAGTGLVSIRHYLDMLPTVTVNGKNYRFLNGVGFGIDGYCCEEGDRLRGTSEKPVNYTAIAIKGLLFHYKPVNAVVTVDGVEKHYKKVWLAPTMNGRYYGGGMIPTPKQDRLQNDTVSTLVMHGSGKLKTLMVFPSIFKGTHIKHTEMAEVLSGKHITVEFDRPTPLQIDGETIPGVTSYSVTAAEPGENLERETAG